jgi:hypothetical protein
MPGHRDTTLLYNKEIISPTMRHATAVLYNKEMKVGGEKWGVLFPAKSPIAKHKSIHFTNSSKVKIHNIYQLC